MPAFRFSSVSFFCVSYAQFTLAGVIAAAVSFAPHALQTRAKAAREASGQVLLQPLWIKAEVPEHSSGIGPGVCLDQGVMLGPQGCKLCCDLSPRQYGMHEPFSLNLCVCGGGEGKGVCYSGRNSTSSFKENSTWGEALRACC